jgi:hypothetical protein
VPVRSRCRFAIVAFALLGLLAAAPGPTARTQRAPAVLPLLHAKSLVYEGAFRLPLPLPLSAKDTFDYGGTALAYDPTRNGLFLVGHAWYQLTAEVSIPRPSPGPRLAGLLRARYLQRFTDATDGLIKRPSSCCGTDVGGQLVFDRRLYGSVYVYYDASDSQRASHWSRPSTSLTHGRARGLFTLGRQGAGFVSGFMAAVPAVWRSSLGGGAITGNCCIPIISRTSFGPAAFAFDPARLTDPRKPAPDAPLFYYPQSHPTIGQWDGSWDPGRGRAFNGNTSITGVVFPTGTRTILFFGRQGTGPFCYGEPTSSRSLNGKPTRDGTTWCYDPDGGGKGPHGYPYQAEVWAYDAGDALAVRQHRKRPWQVEPYAVWRLRLPFGSTQIGGAAYDPAHRLAYVSAQYADGSAPVIAVFKVS